MQVQIQARLDTPILGMETKLSSRSINLQTPEDPVALATPTRSHLLPSICSLRSLRSLRLLPSCRSQLSFAKPRTAVAPQSLLFPPTWLPDPCAKLDCRR